MALPCSELVRSRLLPRYLLPQYLLPCCLLGGTLLLGGALPTGESRLYAQGRRPLEPPVPTQRETPHGRARLILRDGGFQWVLSYRVLGPSVRYRSAERNGAEEEIPLALVDLPATEAWARAHDPDRPQQTPPVPVLSPELAREEAARAARSPQVAENLQLPEEDSVVALDTFQGTPELVPLPQQNSDLNRETAHMVLGKEINPQASPHDLFFLKDERADVQLHVPDPQFFVHLDDSKAGSSTSGGGGFTVDTGGQTGRATPGGGSPGSRYVIERVDVRRGERVVGSFVLRSLSSGISQADLIETHVEPLPGGQWERVTPRQPLAFGEYVLVEVLSDRAVNSSVWDFGVHPTAKENDEAVKPERKRPAHLERREP